MHDKIRKILKKLENKCSFYGRLVLWIKIKYIIIRITKDDTAGMYSERTA